MLLVPMLPTLALTRRHTGGEAEVSCPALGHAGKCSAWRRFFIGEGCSINYTTQQHQGLWQRGYSSPYFVSFRLLGKMYDIVL
ncbi:hypothetical protein FKM82_013668 [Ascaphus truei]